MVEGRMILRFGVEYDVNRSEGAYRFVRPTIKHI